MIDAMRILTLVVLAVAAGRHGSSLTQCLN